MERPGRKLFLAHALLPEGWARDVLLTLRDGWIEAVDAGAAPPADAEHLGVAVPGLPNLHSHAFQRGMAGLAERGGPEGDHFWGWREAMYGFLGRLDPADVEAVSALAYMEMLERGFTAVGEFHYLHHAPDGRPYANPAELSERVAAAAAMTGIGLTLLPVLYAHGGFGGAPPAPGQRRFVLGLDGFAALRDAAARAVAGVPDARLGVAPHSLRAVTADELAALLAMSPGVPVHVHAAEQVREVEDCLAATGMRPVQWLLSHAPVDERWCVIHATHVTESELDGLAASGAVAGVCPVTEANLGDGIFPAVGFVARGGRFGVGSDSNVCISAAGELRALEYSQRLRDRARNRLAPGTGSTGRRLFEDAGRGGARALGRRIGAIAPGLRADVVTLDTEHPALLGREGDRWLDAWIFAAEGGCVRDVFAGGRRVVAGGRHVARAEIVAAWASRAGRLLGG